MISRYATGALAALALVTTTAYAQLPDDRTTQFNIRVNPSDPDSDILFNIEAGLSADSQLTNSIGWEVTWVTIKEYDSNGSLVHKWTDSSPFVDTIDGLWWVTHLDTSDPDDSDFAVPPTINGTATQNNPNVDDLNYDLEGSIYTAPPGGPPFEITASLTYNLTRAAVPEPDPEAEGEDEDIEMPVGNPVE